MIVCNVLVFIAVFAQLQRIYLITSATMTFAVMVIILFPIVGIVADTCIERFKLILASIVSLIVSSFLNILLILLQDHLPATAETICVMCTTGLCCIGASCYTANAFPFAADQLIGASGEQLSFAVYWLSWGFAIAYRALLLNGMPSVYFDTVDEVVSFLCICVTAFLYSKYKRLFIILPRLFNPYKSIFRVLSYAWKHKYPERRSALTYWEENVPSRIDLGMSKYGGPFTVEEVEDVKTFFQLLPVIICGGGCNAGLLIYWYKLLDNEDFFEDFKPAVIYTYLSQVIISAISFPIYHFLLYPLFYNYIPTMLNRIRIGLLFLICSRFMYAFVGELLVCNSLTNTTCLLFHSEMFNISSFNGVWWIIGPTTLSDVGFLLSAITLFEFVCAQSPRPLCGLLTGFCIVSTALSAFIGYGIHKAVAIMTSDDRGWFYSNMIIAFIIFVYFIFFHCISKRYKLRKRDDIIPIHLFAEEFFEKELRGQETLDRERALWQKGGNIVQ